MNAASFDWTLPSLPLPRITPMLARCLLLAALLHVWLLLLLGNVPGGTARAEPSAGRAAKRCTAAVEPDRRCGVARRICACRYAQPNHGPS